jgi:hypothetical protein
LALGHDLCEAGKMLAFLLAHVTQHRSHWPVTENGKLPIVDSYRTELTGVIDPHD